MQDWRELYPDNEIHPSAVIDASVLMGSGNVIGANVVIGPDVVIGNSNYFYPGCFIGTPAQHRSCPPTHLGSVLIGNLNHFREAVTVHRSTAEGPTTIGNSGYFMACAHIPHDAVIEDKVTMCNNALLGGHSHVMVGATIGLGSIIHQYQVIGAYSMLGMGTIVPKKTLIMPGYMYAGNPARELKKNVIGLERNDVDEKTLFELTSRFMELRAK